MTNRKYTKEQIAFMRAGYRKMHGRDLAEAFNARFGTEKTEGAILNTLYRYGIRCGRAPKDRLINREKIFKTEQIAFMRENYRGRSVAEMTALINERFGTEFSEKQVKGAVRNRGIRSGRTGRFEKGVRPWNAGTRGKGLVGPNRGSFRTGNVPANRKPLWSERVDSRDGFVLMKVPETNPYTGFPTRYKQKHVYIWEQAHGPVPKGMVVAFKDGDRTNCVLENLMLISRAELLRLNGHGYRDMPEDLKPSVLALTRLEVKTFERIRERGKKWGVRH